MVRRICKNCKYYNQSKDIIINGGCIDFTEDIIETCKKGYTAYSYKSRCSDFDYKNSIYRLRAKCQLMLYKVYAKIKGINVIIKEEGE